MGRTEISGNSVVLLGYGREGQSVHRWLLKHAEAHPEIKIAIYDYHPVTPIKEAPADTPCFSKDDFIKALQGATTLVRSPGIPLSHPAITEARRRGVHLTSLSNIFFSEAPGKIIGITGTKGKSTTSVLTHAVLSERYADVRLVGNIGTPALDYLQDADENTIFVIELSSFQLEDLHYAPHIAVLQRIVPEHLDHHGSFETYRGAKLRIVAEQSAADFVVLAADVRKELGELFSVTSKEVLYGVAGEVPSCWEEDKVIFWGTREQRNALASMETLPFKGPGNIRNVLAAVSVASILGLSSEEIKSGLKKARALPHRLEHCGIHRGISFYNDSLATIPHATIQALDGLGDEVETLILGGHDRGVDFKPLAEALAARLHIRTLLLFPVTGERILETLKSLYPQRIKSLDFKFVSSMEEAVREAYSRTANGKTCLMSPASSSLNLFRDYQERGELFRRCVEEQGRASAE